MGYPSDLKDKEWTVIEHHFQAQDPRGHASKHPRKQIVDAILYTLNQPQPKYTERCVGFPC